MSWNVHDCPSSHTIICFEPSWFIRSEFCTAMVARFQQHSVWCLCMLCHCTTDPVSVKSDENRDPLTDLFASRFVPTISTLPIASDAKQIVDYYHILKLTRNARNCIDVSGNICNEMQHNFTFSVRLIPIKTIFIMRTRLAKQVWCCNLCLK